MKYFVSIIVFSLLMSCGGKDSSVLGSKCVSIESALRIESNRQVLEDWFSNLNKPDSPLKDANFEGIYLFFRSDLERKQVNWDIDFLDPLNVLILYGIDYEEYELSDISGVELTYGRNTSILYVIDSDRLPFKLGSDSQTFRALTPNLYINCGKE